jgi:hypothetical protein
MATATIDAEILIRTERAIKEIRELPEHADKAAKQIYASLAREWARAEKSSEKHAKEAARAWDKGLDSVKNSAEKLANQLGGPFGDMADLALDLGEKLSGTAGAIGMVGAGAGVALAGVAALAVGAKALADAAVEAADRLVEQGRASEIPAESLMSVYAYEAAGADLRTEIDLLTVAIGSELAGALTTIVIATGDTIEMFRELHDASLDVNSGVGKVREVSEGVMRALQFVVTGGASEGFRLISGEAYEAAAAIHDVVVETEAVVDAALIYGPTLEDMAEGERKAREERERAAEAARRKAQADREAADATREAAAAERERLKAEADWQKFVEENEKDVARARTNMVRMAAAEREAAIASEELDADIQALNESIAAANEHWSDAAFLVQIWGEQLDQVMGGPAFDAALDGFASIIDIQQLQHEQALEQYDERMERREAEIEQWHDGEIEKIDRLVELGELSGKQAILRKREIAEETKAKREALKERTKDERKALLDSFKAVQKLQRVQATVESIRAGVSLIPAFAFMGPGAPIAAAAVAGTALAAALASINAQKPPELPMGRVPEGGSGDHPNLARVRDDEGVLTGRGVATAGGPRAVEALNRGQSPGGAAPMSLHIDGRLVATAVMGHLGEARFSAPSWAAGKRPLYGL